MTSISNIQPPAPAAPNPHDPAFAAEVLGSSGTVAVVGFSSDPSKPSNFAPMELVRRGYDVIAVNPNATAIDGVETVASLADIDRPVDIVDVFRPSAEAAGIAEQAAAIGAKALWLQKGITSPEAQAIAAASGMAYVEDQCVKQVAQGFDLLVPAAS